MRTLLLATVLALVTTACSSSSGTAGAPGTNGKNSLLATTTEAPGAHCASGGMRVDSGLDANGNGQLDASEVASTVYVCNGSAGTDGAPVTVDRENPGANCVAGGVKITPSSGVPTYVCNGVAGLPGAPGQSVTVTPEAAGANCTYGGQKLQVGAGTPSYVCNGAPGATGAAGTSVSVTVEPAGDNCTYGGQKLQVGTATPTYVCNGAPGSNGQDGTSVTMTPEPPGPNCALGGVKLQVGTGTPSYVCNGAASGTTLPTVMTTDVTEVRYTEATVNASVLADGGEVIFTRGVAVATHTAPTFHDTAVFSGVGTGVFATHVTGLAPATTYYVRAFATNALGTSYGEELTFTTLALTVPALTTATASNVTDTTALTGGTVTDDGGSTITARGTCWGLAPDPTSADTCVAVETGTGTGSYVALLTSLLPATGYHVRAYATNAQGTGYGQDVAFTTGELPLATVTTAAASAVSFTTATGGGTVVSDHGAPVSNRGVCWGTSLNPAVGGTCATEAGGLGAFTLPMTGLSAGTLYHVRAFAVNGGGTSYGDDVTFTTLPMSAPVLTTKSVTGISSNIAGSGGVIATDGGTPITQKGVCWGVNPGPTVAGSKTNDGPGTAAYNSTMTGLTPLTTYYVRAYASNGIGIAYGNEFSFTTTDLVAPGPTVPVVGTSPSSITGSTTASSGGYVSNDGGSPVTARGVCWSTSQNPALGGTCSIDGTGIGFFSSSVTGLSGCGVVYYVRAYATNSTGTGYGNQVSVSTGLLPTVTTAAVTDVGYYQATSGGAIVDDGGCAITRKGVAWSWTVNPTTANSSTNDGTGTAPYASSITGLYANRTYYVRAYATNSVGTTYGDQVTFTTLEPATPYIGQNYAGGIVFYLDGTGLHGLVTAPGDTGNQPWGCNGTNVATSTAVGTGATNTAAIIASCSDATFAAKTADALSLGGYDDWFLPSLGELQLMYSNLQAKGLGGFSYSDYLSSSQYTANNAFTIGFYNGSQNWIGKQYTIPFRAIRAF